MKNRTCDNCINGISKDNETKCKASIGASRCIYHSYKVNKGDLCRMCNEEEVHDNLTDGCCLNCYVRLQDDIAEMDRECRLDYLDGCY